MTEGPFKPIPHIQIRPWRQFFIFIGLFAFAYVAGNILGVIVALAKYGKPVLDNVGAGKMDTDHAVSALWVLQFFGTTFPLLVTPVIFSYFTVKEPDEYLKNHFHFSGWLVILVSAIMILAMPLIEFLGIVNQKIHLAQWMIDYEKSLTKYEIAMMNMRSLGDVIYSTLFIGLLTAIVEEIFFRGCLQTILLRWTKNIHAAIWVTAILFSAFHIEFSGFIPRVLLGVLFGYFVAWSGSIWPAILAHFVNNGTIVVWNYFYQHKITGLDPNGPQMFNNTGYIISFILTLVLLFVYKYISDKWHLAHHGEELD